MVYTSQFTQPHPDQGVLGPAPAHYASLATSLPKFNAFGFSKKDFLTRHILLRSDSSGDLYPLTKPSTTPTAFLSTSTSMWHQRLGHPGDELPVHSSDSIVEHCFDIIHSDLWTSPIKKYALQLLKRTHMVKCNPSQKLVDTESKMGPEGCPSTCKSTSGYCVFLGDNLLSWLAKRQHTLSRSSAKDEYHGVANVVVETAWLLNLLRELHYPPSTATLVYCDNVSVVYMSANPVQHQWMKHIEIGIQFVHDMVTAGQVKVLHVPSRYQYADIFTKGLPLALYFDPRMNQGINYPSIVHYLRFFATKFPAIVYNDALASKSDLSSEPTVSPQHVDEISLKNETSLSEYDDVKYNVISYNDLFPFNIFFVDDSKLDTDNDDDNIDIKQYSMDIFIEPLPNVISTDIGTYAQGSNKLLETSHDIISKFFTTETFIKELCVNIVT
ncbi:ribonuclease H-like domain-containing protein [Tanacetum coccineum]